MKRTQSELLQRLASLSKEKSERHRGEDVPGVEESPKNSKSTTSSHRAGEGRTRLAMGRDCAPRATSKQTEKHLEVATEKMSKEGLYYPDGSHKTRAEIQQDNSPHFVMTPDIPDTERSFDDWSTHLAYILEKKHEVFPITNHVEVSFNDGLPKFISLIGDAHIGGDCDYERLNRDVNAIADTEGAYTLLLGDIVDGMFFSSGSTQDRAISISEEVHFARSLMDRLKGSLIAAWGGDHELWAERSGPSMYHDFVSRYQAMYFEGIAFIDVVMGQERIKMAGAHRHLGNSIYSRTAAAQRMHRESAPDCDIAFTGHTHQKGISEQTMRDSRGERKVYFATVGPYKKTDKYARKKGYAPQKGDELGGLGFILYPDGSIKPYYDIVEGVTSFKNL